MIRSRLVIVCRCCLVSQIRCSSGLVFFFFQAEDGIRDLVRSRGLGDVYKRQTLRSGIPVGNTRPADFFLPHPHPATTSSQAASANRSAHQRRSSTCLLYTSDAADERSSVDLGGRRIIKKKKNIDNNRSTVVSTNT